MVVFHHGPLDHNQSKVYFLRSISHSLFVISTNRDATIRQMVRDYSEKSTSCLTYVIFAFFSHRFGFLETTIGFRICINKQLLEIEQDNWKFK